MTRIQFILELTDRLKKLPKADREKALEYYLELIDDRIDDGVQEEEAVAAVGSLDEITEQILGDVPLTKLAKASLAERKMKPWVIVLLIAGLPIWISVLSVIISLYASVLSVVVSLFAASVALGVCAPVALLLGIQFLIKQGFAVAFVYWGMALACAGLAVFLWIGGHYAVKGSIWISKKFWLWVKSLFLRKEDGK